MKKALCLILTLILCLPSFAAFADIEGTVQGDIMLTSTEGEAVESTNKTLVFSDIVADSILGEAVYKLVNAKVISGYPDGTFRPNAGLTRAELCKMINLVFDLDKKADKLSFKDVKEGNDWYYEYVLVAVEAGYIKGFDDNTFRGDDPVTREQACAIISRVTAAKNMGLFDLPFTDNITDNVSDWAIEDVKKIIANYIMPLEAGGKFRATENITRAELALALEGFVVILPEYTVKFETNGGSEIASVLVKEGKTVEKPKDPTKKDFTFNGWYEDSNLKNAYNFETTVKSDITLYAKWKANSTGGGVNIPTTNGGVTTYTVKFDSKGGSEIESVTVTSGSLLSAPTDPTKELKIFTGWYTDSACTSLYDFTIPVTNSFTLYAGWEDDIAAINENKLQDIRIFKDVLAGMTFDIQPHTDMTNILIETFEDILSGGPYTDFIVDEDYIRTSYESDMLEIEDIWSNQLFVDDLGDEKQQYKNKMGEAIAQARVNGFSMTLSQSYEWFRKIINGIISWE